VIKPDGTLRCWGSNTYGESTPPSGTYIAVDAGQDHTCAVNTLSRMVCWGRNDVGQSTLFGGRFSGVSAGNKHSCGIQVSGGVLCWGDNSSGQANPPDPF
jgi:alpha-tubulin suppressor-like RCC1 family protein